MPSLIEAMRTAKLIDSSNAERVEQEKNKRLHREERMHASIAASHTWDDIERQEKQERFLRGAAKETTKASSRVGTRQYLDRFKK